MAVNGKKLRLALVINELIPYKGGLQRFTFNFLTDLLTEELDVYLLTSKLEYDSNHIEEIKEDQFRVTLENSSGFVWCRIAVPAKPSVLKLWSFLSRTQQVIDQERFDVVYSISPLRKQDIFRLGGGIHQHWMKVRYPNPFIRWMNYIFRPIQLMNLVLERKIFQQQHATIVANSQLGKKQVLTYYQYPEHLVHVIYNGVDHALFNPENAALYRSKIRLRFRIPLDAQVILFVANDWQRKGLHTLIHALGELKKRNLSVHALIVGRGRKNKLEPLLDHYQLNDTVHFTGIAQDVLPYYGAADLFVLPTLYDPFANVCLEAMACGLPVVTTLQNGASEIIENGKNGLILRTVHDHHELAEILWNSFLTIDLRELSRAAYHKAQRYTIQQNVRENLKVIMSLNRHEN